jgi:preprotein translocase subunit SecB
MATTTNGGQQGGPGAPAAGASQASAEQAAQINVLAQYTKDLSFENPNAPRSLQPSQQPSINLQINVNSKPLSDTDFEIELMVEGKADAAGTVLFTFELVYAGIFRLHNVPADAVQAVMMIECPRLLFPYAREIVSGAVRNGGFPPLMIDPVDFVSLYRQKMQQAQAAPASN